MQLCIIISPLPPLFSLEWNPTMLFWWCTCRSYTSSSVTVQLYYKVSLKLYVTNTIFLPVYVYIFYLSFCMCSISIYTSYIFIWSIPTHIIQDISLSLIFILFCDILGKYIFFKCLNLWTERVACYLLDVGRHFA